MTLILRGLSVNRHIRSRTFVSAVLFAAYASIALVMARAPLEPSAAAQLRLIQPLVLTFAIVNLVVTLAINPWRIDRLPDRFPNIVQDAIIIAIFGLVATVLLPSELLATTAVGAVILGLALQDTLGNLFAGLAIQVEKPFKVGHWVNIDGKDGIVSEITWRATKIRTKAGILVVVPNSVLARDTITNYSEPTPQLRLQVEVGASYDTPPNEVKATIRAAIADEPLIDKNREVEVLMGDFAASAITYRVWVWTSHFDADDYIYDRVRSRIYYAFKRRGIVIPYPIQVEMHGKEPEPPRDSDKAALVRGLKNTTIFSTLSDEQLFELVRASRYELFAAGEAIVREGDEGSSMFLLCRGEATVALAGASQPVARLRAGDFFGEMSLLTGAHRSATVAGVTDCELLEIEAGAFRQVVLSDPAMVEQITHAMETRKSELDQYRATRSIPPPGGESPHALLDRVRQFLRLSVTTS